MAKNLSAGQVVRILGREYTVKSVNDNAATGERVIQVHLTAVVGKEVEDEAPADVNDSIQELLGTYGPLLDALLQGLVQ